MRITRQQGFTCAFLIASQHTQAFQLMPIPTIVSPQSSSPCFSRTFSVSYASKVNDLDNLQQFVGEVENIPLGGISLDAVAEIERTMDQCVAMANQDGAQMAEKLLKRMILERKTGSGATTRLFNKAMSAWIECGEEGVAKKVDAILTAMNRMYEAGHTDVKPDIESYNLLLDALSKHRGEGADQRAWAVLKGMKDPRSGVEPSAESYAATVECLARAKERGAAQRADALLRETINLFPEMDANRLVRCVNVVIMAFSKSGDANSGERAEGMLEVMIKLSHDARREDMLKPNIFTYTGVISAWANEKSWASAQRVDRILDNMYDAFLQGTSDVEPDLFCATTVANAWKRLSKQGDTRAAANAEKILRRMIEMNKRGISAAKPDSVLYAIVHSAWIRCKNEEGTKKATELLEEMIRGYKAGDESLKPSSKNLQLGIDALARSDDDGAMERAESLLEMLHDHNVKSNDDLKDAYRSIINGWAKRNLPSRAEGSLKKMLDRIAHPDNYYFDKVIDAWARSGADDSGQRASDIFQLMEEEYGLTPTERTYTSVVKAVGNSREPGKAEKARNILVYMNEIVRHEVKECAPSIFTYNAVLNACALTEAKAEKAKAFELGVVTFNELRNSKLVFPDSTTYGNLIRCSVLREGEERNKFAKAAFRECCERGLVNEAVLRSLQQCVPELMMREVLGLSEDSALVDVQKTPSSWTANARKTPNR